MCPPSLLGGEDPSPQTSTAHVHFLPPGDLSLKALDLAKAELPQAILNHSVRVYLYAKWLAEKEHSTWATPDRIHLLFVACIHHDMGASHTFDGDQRFEVEGADVAASHLRSFNVSEADIHEVWTAVALHTSPGIAERISSLAELVRKAVLIDFNKQKLDSEEAESLKAATETDFPRLEPEKILGDAVVEQALRRRAKAPPASWPGILLRAHLEDPDWKGVNRAF